MNQKSFNNSSSMNTAASLSSNILNNNVSNISAENS